MFCRSIWFDIFLQMLNSFICSVELIYIFWPHKLWNTQYKVLKMCFNVQCLLYPVKVNVIFYKHSSSKILVISKIINMLPKIDTKRYSVRSNQITALISKSFTLVIFLVRKWGWNQWNDSIRSAVNRRKFN